METNFLYLGGGLSKGANKLFGAVGSLQVQSQAATIAALAGSETIQPSAHLAKALQYRPKLLVSG